MYFKADNWIDTFGGWLKDKVGVDLTSHGDTKEWFKTQVTKLGADVDTSGNCYIVFGETLDYTDWA